MIELTPDAFEMVEIVSKGNLARHPVWAPFGDPGDRELILSWGVDAGRLDAEIARFDDCGPSVHFPVLDHATLPEKRGLIVVAHFRCANGAELEGWVLEPHAFGLFAGERELTFNRTLPRQGASQSALLAHLLGCEPHTLFPLRFTTASLRADGQRLSGEIGPF